MEHVDCIVVGAGVVGLAVARALALDGREVLLLEAADTIGSGVSSRNSEVIHAGIYYPPGSLKARLCVAGRDALYAYCESHGLPHRRIGKLIVATDESEAAALEGLEKRARANGVDDLLWLDGDQARALEPQLRCVRALLSPSTGIIDSHAYMLALQGDLETAGGMLALRSEVLGARVHGSRLRVRIGGEAAMELDCTTLVLCAGLGTQALAARIAGVVPASVPALHLAKGNYFVLTGRSPFTRLVYPVPLGGGLGVHSTLDLAGRTRFGPDVEWVDSLDYDVDPTRGEVFYAAIRRYWPGLADGMLEPGYAGIRPKIAAARELAGDFRIQGPGVNGVVGLFSLYGMESPGLTASLALAQAVAEQVAAGDS